MCRPIFCWRSLPKLLLTAWRILIEKKYHADLWDYLLLRPESRHLSGENLVAVFFSPNTECVDTPLLSNIQECASRLLNFTAVIDCPQKRWSEVCQVISVPVKKLCEYPILVRIIITGIFTGLGSIFFLPFFVGFEGRGEVVCPVKSCPM